MANRILIFIFILLLAGQCLAGNFTIEQSTDVKTSSMYAKAGNTLKNYGNSIYMNIGSSYGVLRSLIQFETLADSMKQVFIDSNVVIWDSAVLTLTVVNLTSVDDSIFISLYKVIRDWTEGVGSANDTCGVCWDSANAIGYTGCTGDAANWGTNGCDNITTDRSATRENCSDRVDSILLCDEDATETTKTFGISSATITDTLGYGLLLVPVWISGSSSPYGAFFSEDYTIKPACRPKIQVWYHLMGKKVIIGKSIIGNSKL